MYYTNAVAHLLAQRLFFHLLCDASNLLLNAAPTHFLATCIQCSIIHGPWQQSTSSEIVSIIIIHSLSIRPPHIVFKQPSVYQSFQHLNIVMFLP